MQKRILILSTLSILFFILLIGCSKSDYGSSPYNNTNTGTPGSNEVFIQNISFSPKSLTVTMGTTVKWTNKDNVAHTVTSGTPGSPNGTFDSGNLGSGATFSYAFNTKGSFSYYCKLHQDVMTGTVTVQ